MSDCTLKQIIASDKIMVCIIFIYNESLKKRKVRIKENGKKKKVAIKETYLISQFLKMYIWNEDCMSGYCKSFRFGRQSRQDEKRSRAYVSETITVRMDEFVHAEKFLQTKKRRRCWWFGCATFIALNFTGYKSQRSRKKFFTFFFQIKYKSSFFTITLFIKRKLNHII